MSELANASPLTTWRGSNSADVRSLQSLGAPGDFKLHSLTFVQRFVPLGLNRREVDENVLAGLALNKTETFAGVKPLYCSLFSQLGSHFS